MRDKRIRLPKDHPDAPRPFWRPDGDLVKWNAPRIVLGTILLAWALLITWLLLGSPTRLTGPIPWLRPAGHFAPLARVYGALFVPHSWNWLVGAETWIDVGIGAAGLALMMLVGRFFVSCFEIYVPRLVELALWFVMGVGLCGVVYTFLALAGLLYQWLALLALAVLLATLWRLSRRARRRINARAMTEAGQMMRDSTGKEDRKPYRAQRGVTRRWERESWLLPVGKRDRILLYPMVGLIALITLLTFYHALFFAEVYWDSLILYLGYARGIFLEHRFPVKVVAQVGVGLGANYPHLYELTGATIATWARRWSPIYLQLASPVAGLLTMFLVYHTVLRLSRSVLLSVAATLLVRSAPYLISFHVYASNYSFVVLFCAAFIYCALCYIETGLPGYLALATLCAAFGMHINYLMGVLWICWVVTVIVAHWPKRLPPGGMPGKHLGIVRTIHQTPAPAFTGVRKWPTLAGVLCSPMLWRNLAWGAAISSVWYVRNWIVTGNPVYAFFTGIFKGTKHCNPEVMASAAREWQAHGDGIGIAGETLAERLAFTWPFFVNNFTTCYKWGPMFAGVVVPGVVICLCILAWQFCVPRRIHPGEDDTLADLPEGKVIAPEEPARLGVVALTLLGALFAYHYCLGPFYMYHLLGCFAVFGVFIYFALRSCPRPFLLAFCVWAIFCGLMPGLPWAMVGSKFTGSALVGKTRYNGMELVALRNPGLDPGFLYRLRFGPETLVWEQINSRAKGRAVLTHENRRLLFDPSIRLVHMDDWEVQEIWGKSKRERLERLAELGVAYYLQIPYEFDHPVNARLGHREWIDDGTLKKVFQAGESILYEFNYPEDLSKRLPRDEALNASPGRPEQGS